MNFVARIMKTENVDYNNVKVFRGNQCVDGGCVKATAVNEYVDFIRKYWQENHPNAKIKIYIHQPHKLIVGCEHIEYVKNK